MITDIWSGLRSEPNFYEFEMRLVDAPCPDAHSMTIGRRLCQQNKCGTYNRNWGCPPGVGTEEDCLGLIHQYKNAVLISRRFEDIAMDDLERIDMCACEMQDMVRRLCNAMRDAGFDDVFPLADGGCKYCGDCTYPDEPCRFPLQMVPSVSGYGISMEAYARSQGVDYKLEDDCFTLYGMVLYN